MMRLPHLSNYRRLTVFEWAQLGISAIAAIYTVFNIGWARSGHTANDFWGRALIILFVFALGFAFAEYFVERPRLLATTPPERFPEPSISRFFLGSGGSAGIWFVVRMYVGTEWLLAGWEKAASPAWGTSGIAMRGFVKGALARATGAHPAVEGWYAGFLRDVVLPYVHAWSFAITWGEVAVGVGLLFGALTGIAAGFGVLMNFDYLLAGSVSVNPVLGMLGLFLVIAWRVSGRIGLDFYLLPALGLPWKPGVLFTEADAHTPGRRPPQAHYSGRHVSGK